MSTAEPTYEELEGVMWCKSHDRPLYEGDDHCDGHRWNRASPCHPETIYVVSIDEEGHPGI